MATPHNNAPKGAFAKTVLTELGIDKITLNINSIGCPNCRKTYNEALKNYFRPYIEDGTLCQTCRERFDKNPLRT